MRHWRWQVVMAFIVLICAILPLALRFSSNHLPSTAIEILQHADHFELLSLDPRLQSSPENDSFHGYRVLRRVTISDATARKKLISALRQGMRENSGIAACFNPRHGIHAENNGRQADLVICFECLQVQLFGDAQGEFLVSGSPQSIFDGTLKASSNALTPSRMP